MINFKDAKKLLIPALKQYGYQERTEKSCRSYKVFSNGSTTLLLKPNAAGVYDYYSNKTDEKDFGDITQFILSQKLNIYQHGKLNLSAKEYNILADELKKIGANSVEVPMFEAPTKPKEIFSLDKYNIVNIEPNTELPSSPQSFLFKRRINIDLGHEDFRNSVALLKSDKGYSSLIFFWRDAKSNIVGAQYKYIQNDVCVKRFLKNTDRENSLWSTKIEGKDRLFVTEDPLDAIAHRQLYPEKNFAYVCTGGTSSLKQRELINLLSKTHNLPIVLGNDNDVPGQIANYKICYTNDLVKHDKENMTLEITSNSQTTIVTESEFTRYVKVAAAKLGVQVELPEYKDWNDYLLPKKKSNLLQGIINNVDVKMVTHENNLRVKGL